MYKKTVHFLRGSALAEVQCACPERVLNLCSARKLAFWDLEWEGAETFTCRMSRGDHRILSRAAEKLDFKAARGYLTEALERWPQQLVETLLPRVWQIIQEIARRWQEKVENFFHDPSVTEKMAIVWGGEVRMANLCVAGGLSVNGVSGLHSEILKKDVFKNSYAMEPWKFTNVTNGIDHRRWASQINRGLDGLICDLAGDGYLTHPQELKKLEAYADDASVLKRLEEIKHQNKLAFAAYAKKQQGVVLNTDAIFDVQVKRLHEYKRQQMLALYIIWKYLDIKNGNRPSPHHLSHARTLSGFQ